MSFSRPSLSQLGASPSFVKWGTWLSLVCLVFLTSLPLFRSGYFTLHDPLSLARIGEMLRALQAGHLPPRWSQNFGYGYGIPLFEFYAPLPYFVGALVLAITGAGSVTSAFGGEVAFKALFLIPNLVSAIGAYKLGKKLYGDWQGLLLATLFTLAPYRAVDLFVRGASSESWGMMAFPWILLGIHQVIKKQKTGHWLLIASLVTLFLSHNITTLLFMPLAVLTALGWWLSNSEQDWKKNLPIWKELCIDLLVATGLSSFYLLPAFFEKNLVNIAVTTSDYYHYANHFLYLRQLITPFWGYGDSVWGPNDGLSFFLGYGTLLGLVIATLALVVQGFRKIISLHMTSEVWQTLMWGLLMIMSIFLTLTKSQFIWDHIPPLAFAQFPWRSLGSTTIFSSLFIVAGLNLITHHNLRKMALIGLLLVTILANTNYFQPQNYLPSSQTTYFTDAAQIKNSLGSTLLEYIPINTPNNPVALTEIATFEPKTEYQVVTNKVEQHAIGLTVTQPTTVTWQVVNYPGWQPILDGQDMPISTNKQNLITQQISPGAHVVKLNWTETPVRLLSDMISLISFAALVGWIFMTRQSPAKIVPNKHAKK